MIGMMYLVLTALLALQVSSAILLKFQYLDDSLMTVNYKTVEDNTGTVKGIGQAVQKNGNAPDDRKVMAQANEVRTRTNELVTYMRSLRDLLIEKSGGPGQEGEKYAAPSEEEAIVRAMVGGPNKDGKGYELEKKLNDYASYLRSLKVEGVEIPAKLALSGKEDPTASKDPNQKNKDFPQLSFENTPLVAGLAVLAQKEAEVLKHETNILKQLASKVGASQLKFDQIMGTATAESNTVAAGTKYKAEMFLTAFSSNLTPKMSSSVGPVKVVNGRGQVEFTASAGGPKNKDGLIEKSWSGKITLTNNGKDTTIAFTQKYFVVEPVLSISSSSVSALYLKVANRLTALVPALGANYNPAFSGSGASFARGTKKEEVVIAPNGLNPVTLVVSSGGAKIGQQTFQVRRVPLPQVNILVNSRPVDLVRGIPVTSPRTVNIDIQPDKDFERMYPDEAKYRVTSFEVQIGRGGQQVDKVNFSAGSGNIAPLLSKLRPNDQLFVKVKEIVRINYKGDFEDIPVPQSAQVNIPLR
ncbi:MAG: gliding motility protein GldM [Adhaeribacter sp.]